MNSFKKSLKTWRCKKQNKQNGGHDTNLRDISRHITLLCIRCPLLRITAPIAAAAAHVAIVLAVWSAGEGSARPRLQGKDVGKRSQTLGCYGYRSGRSPSRVRGFLAPGALHGMTWDLGSVKRNDGLSSRVLRRVSEGQIIQIDN